MNDKYLNDILEKQAYIQQNMPKKDPFDKGIMRAIKSAKRSLAMDEEQDDRAMRESILTFGEEMHKMPKTRGFIGNLAQVGRAMGPAIKTHDGYEDQAKAENKVMLQYAQQLRAAEEAKMANLEQQAYLREHADQQLNFQREQLAEQKAYHNLMGEAAKAKAYAKSNENAIRADIDENGLVEGKYVPFMNKKDRDPYNKKLMGANLVAKHVSDAKEILDQFDTEHKGELLNAPLIGTHMGKTKSILGHFSGNNQMIKDANDRIKLDQAIGTIATKFEKELKGGILTGDIIKRFQAMGIVPVATDSPSEIRNKLTQMLKTAEEEQDIAKRSLTNNYHYMPSDSGKVVSLAIGDPTDLNSKITMIKMINPDTNEEYTISKDDDEVLKALEIKGFKPLDSKLNKKPIDTKKQDDSVFNVPMQYQRRPLFLRGLNR